jgi:hypothetical protein
MAEIAGWFLMALVVAWTVFALADGERDTDE